MEEDRRIGKYRIIHEIGRGGFATVWRALDTSLNRPVALKILDPLLMRDPNWTERFHKEAQAYARLDHPNIVTVYEIDEIEGRLFIAMQLVDGSDLSTYIGNRGALTWNKSVV